MVGIEEEEHLATACAAEKGFDALAHKDGLADPWPNRTDVTA